MKAFRSFNQRYLCRRCNPHLRHSAQSLNLSRLSSTLASSKPTNFSWFFFHNDRWGTNPELWRSHLGDAMPPPITQAIATQTLDMSQYPPSSAVYPYKQTEAMTSRQLLKVYWQLSKPHLSMFVILAAMSGVALSPLPTTVPVLLSTAIGTALCSASANSLNQIQEVPFDAQMARTRGRPLVRHAISPLHATGYAVLTGIAGPALLWTMTTPTTALLGAANIALYAGAYTWLKRKSVVNTWVGSVVGALPPLMGWTACGGTLFPSSAHPIEIVLPSFLSAVSLDLHAIDNPLAPLALFIFMFCWQFPHFNALSHLLRESYAQAGYRMLCVLSPTKNALVALRYALLPIPLCSILIPLSGLTSWTFAIVSLVPNAICAEAAWRFWRNGRDKDARRLFQHSLWYLPVMLGLMMICKRGLDWGSWLGTQEDGEDEARESSSITKA
ncbi:protoheme IX farnesyltransferase [Laetiporus sulphureus 93-53]|uniref:Protoheme IX farnesyltransferase, mitochondrial n=1 Tax=Laetiporus sulphureus 93-53 TaxID=1314785 RepID=A0A165CJ32_9APHY|nr:protoheme IX farnesyltransferase [Laetiporus sulphureus 93-53]KZT02900.1 protoheme IX farnesyltransferase [Laetiporus sulphureus 93-53]